MVKGKTLTIIGASLVVAGLVLLLVVPAIAASLGVSPPAGWPGHCIALVQVKDSNGFWIQGNVNWEWWRGSTLKKSGTQATHSDDYLSCYVIVPDYGYQAGDVYKFWATSGGRQSDVVTKTATAEQVSNWKSYPAIWPLFSMSLVVPAAPAPPSKATISATTTGYPCGDVIVNNELWGFAPVRRDVDPGTYTVSFSTARGYAIPTPASQTRTLSAGQTWNVVGDYGAWVGIPTTPTPTPTPTPTTTTPTTPTPTPTGEFITMLGLTDFQVVQGETKTLTTLTSMAIGTWTQNISLSFGAIPVSAGFSLSFNPSTIAVGQSSTLSGNFTNAPVGAWAVTVRAASGSLTRTEEITITVLPRATYKILSGVVQDSGGAPLGGVKVSAVISTAIPTYTSDAGRYELRLEPGDYTIMFEKSGYKTKGLNITLAQDMTRNVTLEPEPIAGPVSFQIAGAAILVFGLCLVAVGVVKKW